jgi:hypothetical protein
MASPKLITHPESCPVKGDLMTRLCQAHARIVALHGQELEILLRGDFRTDDLLEGALNETRERRGAIIDELKDHMTTHGC